MQLVCYFICDSLLAFAVMSSQIVIRVACGPAV